MPSTKHHLSATLKASMKRQSILAHGFQKDQSLAITKSSIDSAIRILQQHRPSSWHLVLVTAYTGFNFPQGVATLWSHIVTSLDISQDRKVEMGAQMKEGILKCIPFIGIPRVLHCIGALHIAQKEFGEECNALLRGLRDDVARDVQIMTEAGTGLWDDVYSPPKLSDKLRGKIASWHPELADLIVRSSYGDALSATRVVGREDTSAIAVTVLRVEEDVLDQLTSHVFGLLKGGGDQAYCQAIIDVVDGLRSGNMSSLVAKL